MTGPCCKATVGMVPQSLGSFAVADVSKKNDVRGQLCWSFPNSVPYCFAKKRKEEKAKQQ